MSDLGKSERETQRRVIALFRDELNYRYLGSWTDRPGNSNIEEDPADPLHAGLETPPPNPQPTAGPARRMGVLTQNETFTACD